MKAAAQNADEWTGKVIAENGNKSYIYKTFDSQRTYKSAEIPIRNCALCENPVSIDFLICATCDMEINNSESHAG